MSIKRIVPNITSEETERSKEFYQDILGMEVVMDMDWVITFASPKNPSAQITLLKPQTSEIPNPHVSIEVEDLDSIYQTVIERGLKVVYPLTNEPWGVRRFFVEDPNGVIINVMMHSS